MANRPSKLSPSIREEASRWFVELNEGNADAAAREQFSQWLRASPEHIRAFLKISVLWENAGAIDKGGRDSVEQLIERALTEDNVVPLPSGDKVVQRDRSRSVKGSVLAVAASVLFAVAASAVWLYKQSGTYSTAVGEQRSIVLSDGSVVYLNTGTRIRVHIAARERGVDLLEGQALFQVAKDMKRPFVVRSDSMRVQALGTQFEVYRAKSGTVVTVMEGSVAVQDRQSGVQPLPVEVGTGASGKPVRLPAKAVLVSAGERVTAADLIQQPERVNVSAALAWTQRRLIFRTSPLTEVVEEYNRYHQRHLIIRDARLGKIPVSGIFSATDSASLIAFLREQPNIIIHESDREVEIGSP